MRRRIFPPALKYFSTAFDIVLLTCLATAVVGLGLAQIEPGLGMLFGFVCFPALVVTLVRTWAEQQVKET